MQTSIIHNDDIQYFVLKVQRSPSTEKWLLHNLAKKKEKKSNAYRVKELSCVVSYLSCVAHADKLSEWGLCYEACSRHPGYL